MGNETSVYKEKKMLNFFYKVIRCVQWLPILWKNYDFDSHYLLIVMEYKLKRMEKLFKNYGTCVGSGQAAKEIHVARLLIKRILEDNYYDMVVDWVDSESILDLRTTKRPMVPNQKAWDYAEYMKHQDFEYLLGIFKKHFFCWWD